MKHTHEIILYMGIAVMALIYLLCARSSSKPTKWIGVAAMVLTAPFFYRLGSFGDQFYTGQCYSSVIQSIAEAVDRTDAPRSLAEQIKALPMSGYETSCWEVKVASEKLSRVKTP